MSSSWAAVAAAPLLDRSSLRKIPSSKLHTSNHQRHTTVRLQYTLPSEACWCSELQPASALLAACCSEF